MHHLLLIQMSSEAKRIRQILGVVCDDMVLLQTYGLRVSLVHLNKKTKKTLSVGERTLRQRLFYRQMHVQPLRERKQADFREKEVKNVEMKAAELYL